MPRRTGLRLKALAIAAEKRARIVAPPKPEKPIRLTPRQLRILQSIRNGRPEKENNSVYLLGFERRGLVEVERISPRRKRYRLTHKAFELLRCESAAGSASSPTAKLDERRST